MFKKLLTVVAILTTMISFSQEINFGVQGGYINIEGKSSNSLEDISTSGNSSGFYLGALVDFTLSDHFHLQPSVHIIWCIARPFHLQPPGSRIFIYNLSLLG